MNCRHCRKPLTYRRPRSLCWSCYDRFRDLYPSVSKFARKVVEETETMEQVEAIIAEQMKCLPPWWFSEGRKPKGHDVKLDTVGVEVPRAVMLGKGVRVEGGR